MICIQFYVSTLQTQDGQKPAAVVTYFSGQTMRQYWLVGWLVDIDDTYSPIPLHKLASDEVNSSQFQ